MRLFGLIARNSGLNWIESDPLLNFHATFSQWEKSQRPSYFAGRVIPRLNECDEGNCRTSTVAAEPGQESLLAHTEDLLPAGLP